MVYIRPWELGLGQRLVECDSKRHTIGNSTLTIQLSCVCILFKKIWFKFDLGVF